MNSFKSIAGLIESEIKGRNIKQTKLNETNFVNSELNLL